MSSSSCRLSECLRSLHPRERIVWLLLAIVLLPFVIYRTIEVTLHAETRLFFLILLLPAMAGFFGWQFERRGGPRVSARFWVVFGFAVVLLVIAAGLVSISLAVLATGVFVKAFLIRHQYQGTWLHHACVTAWFVILSMSPYSLTMMNEFFASWAARIAADFLDVMAVPNVLLYRNIVTPLGKVDVAVLGQGLEVPIILGSVVCSFLVFAPRSWCVSLMVLLLVPLACVALNVGQVLLMVKTASQPIESLPAFVSFQHVMWLTLVVVSSIALVNFVRVLFGVVPPPRAISKMPVSVRAFNIIMQWPNELAIEAPTAATVERSKLTSADSDRLLDQKLDTDPSGQVEASGTEVVEEDDADDDESFEDEGLESSTLTKPKDLALLLVGAMIGLLAALAVAGQSFLFPKEARADAVLVALNEVIAGFDLPAQPIVTETKDDASIQQEQNTERSDSSILEGPSMVPLISMEDFLAKYGEKHDAILVPEVDSTALAASDGSQVQSRSKENSNFQVYRFLRRDSNVFRTVWLAIYASKTKKLVTEGKVVAEPFGWRFVSAWWFNMAPSEKYLAVELRQDSSGPLSQKAIRAGDAAMERLIQQVGEVKP